MASPVLTLDYSTLLLFGPLLVPSVPALLALFAAAAAAAAALAVDPPVAVVDLPAGKVPASDRARMYSDEYKFHSTSLSAVAFGVAGIHRMMVVPGIRHWT